MLCVGDHAEEHTLKEAQICLNVTKIDSIPHNFLLRRRLFRNLFLMIFQIFKRQIPLTALPFSIGRAKSEIRNRISSTDAQIIVWDGLHPLAALWSHQTLQGSRKGIQIYRAHNVESELWKQYTQQTKRITRPYFTHQSELMRKFEQECLSFVDLTLPMSDLDGRILKESFSLNYRAETIPVSIPNQYLAKHNSTLEDNLDVKIDDGTTQLRLLWLGGIDWWPNNEGLRWFLNNVWPSVSTLRADIHLDIVGKNTDILKNKETHNATFHGFVDDYSAIFRKADLLIVPIFSGSGVRIKAIEAMNQGLPCLGTTTGLSSLPHEGCWISDQSFEWISLLNKLTKAACKNRGLIAKEKIHDAHNHKKSSVKLENLILGLLSTGVHPQG